MHVGEGRRQFQYILRKIVRINKITFESCLENLRILKGLKIHLHVLEV